MTKRTHNVLSNAQMFQLCSWVRDNAAALDGLSSDHASAMAAEALGIQVTRQNLRAAREASGAKFRLKHDRLQPDAAAVGAEQMLAAELVKLMRKLGEPVSRPLLSLAKGGV